MLLEVGMIVSKYVVESGSDLHFEEVDNSNRYFTKGKHKDGFTFWKTSDGTAIYSELVAKSAPTVESIAPES